MGQTYQRDRKNFLPSIVFNENANNEPPAKVLKRSEPKFLNPTENDMARKLSKFEGKKATRPRGRGNTILNSCYGAPTKPPKLLF